MMLSLNAGADGDKMSSIWAATQHLDAAATSAFEI